MKNNFVTPKTIGLLFLFTSILILSCNKETGLQPQLKIKSSEIIPASTGASINYQGKQAGPARLRVNRFGNIDYLNISDGC